MTSPGYCWAACLAISSTGAGASSRHSVGTGVIGGMLAKPPGDATFSFPMLFMLIMRRVAPPPVAVSQRDGKDA